MKNIEVEFRTFISKEKYLELLNVFPDCLKERQITTYFDCNKDFRLMQTKYYNKLWLKEGKLHDNSRLEHEVLIDNKYKDSLKKLLNSLGYNEQIKWYRTRNTKTTSDNITITIDYSIGYGYIVEAEILVENSFEIDETKQKLLNYLKGIGIDTISSKEEFNNKYEDYKKNWEEYTKEIIDDIFLKGE